MPIGLTDYIKPKNDAFTGIVQASQVLGGGGHGTLPDACVAASNVTQHEGSMSLANLGTRAHSNLTGVGTDDHHAKSHASTHGPAGPDQLKLDDLETPDDNTDLNVSTTAHGLCPKSPNDATQFLNGGNPPAWSVPPGGGGGEANTASNVNVGGVGVFKQKTGVDLEFRGVNAASSKISVALDAGNNEIDVDAVEANFSLANLGTRAHSNLTGVGTDDHHAKSHASTHGPAGPDQLKLDDLETPDDNTDLDVSTSAHGLCPKLPNDSKKVLDGAGSWVTATQPQMKLVSTFIQSPSSLFLNVHTCAGANFKHFCGLGIEANLSGTVTVSYIWEFPQVIPPGSFKMRVWFITAAVNGGTIKARPKWVSFGSGDPSSVSLNSEEQLTTAQWTTGDDDEVRTLIFTLDQDTPVAGELCLMNLEITNGTTAPDEVVTMIEPRLYWA